jgi:hypothetical protein
MIDLDSMSDEDKLAALESIHKSIAESKELQKQKIAANVDLVLQALKKMESDIRARYDETGKIIEKRVASIKDGRDGRNGLDGKNGKDGRNGKDGAIGPRGNDGLNGINGVDGQDGVSVTDAKIDFDGSLIITLSTGQEINVGEVVSPDLADKIQVISTMSTNGAVGISDEGSSISTGVKNINFVGAAVTASASGDDVTVNVSSGTGTVTSVAVSGGTTGLTTSGGPITTTGTITLGGTLAVASGGTGTATPGLVAGTNITSITGSWPNQTINAGGGSGTVTSVAATVPAFLSVTGSPITTSGTLAIGLSGSALPVANGGTGVTTSTGTTNVVLSNSPTLVTPNLGTPSALVGTNITGTATAFTASNVTTNANLTGAVTSVGNATSLGSFTSAQLLGALTDETGTGAAVFATSPTLVTPALGTPASGVVTNLTGTASININGTVGATTPAAGTFTSLSDSGNLTFTGTGNRITGDFSNGTVASRAMFQTSTTNGATNVSAIPNGTSVIASIACFDNSDTTNAAFGQIRIQNATDVRINSSITGTGTYLPMTFYTGGSERVRVDTSGNVGIGTSSPTQKLQVAGNQLLANPGSAVFTYFDSVSNSIGRKSTGELTLTVAAGSPTVFVNNTTESMRIDSSGRLLIASTVAANGNFLVNNGTNKNVQIRGAIRLGGSSIQSVQSDLATDSPLEIFTGAQLQLEGNPITFYNGGERMRIDSSGNVGIGTSSPSSKLEVYDATTAVARVTAGTEIFEIRNTGSEVRLAVVSADPMTFRTSNVEAMRLDSSGNLLFNSGYGSVATAYGCRAWVNFNGTGTVAIRASGNVSSITDNGAGDYTVNFTTAMSDANYSVHVSGNGSTINDFNNAFVAPYVNSPSTSSIRVKGNDTNGTARDQLFVYVAIFR